MGRKWNEIVQLSEWQTPLGKLAFVLGVEDDGTLETELQRAFPACFTKGEDEGPVPWTAIEVENVNTLDNAAPTYVSIDALDYLSVVSHLFALTSTAASQNDIPELPSGSYAFRDEFEHDGVAYVVVMDQTVDNDATICAIKKDDVNWDA